MSEDDIKFLQVICGDIEPSPVSLSPSIEATDSELLFYC